MKWGGSSHMLVTILAVTNTRNEYCIAGMDEEGRWIRPIPISGGRFWSRDKLILPDKGSYVTVGDQWEIIGQTPQFLQYSNHIEDFQIAKRSYVKTLTNEELLNLLETYIEDEQTFIDTVNANGRSLCLIKVPSVYGYSSTYNGNISTKMDIEEDNYLNPHTNSGNYPIKCCKWERIILNGEHGYNFERTYVCIGLATPWNGIEYPQIIGLHTDPEVGFPNTYPL
jgi:hypothetical protein